MVALLPQDDDQSIADDLSYWLIIVPWQEMGVKAVRTAVERGRWCRGRCRLSCSYLILMSGLYACNCEEKSCKMHAFLVEEWNTPPHQCCWRWLIRMKNGGFVAKRLTIVHRYASEIGDEFWDSYLFWREVLTGRRLALARSLDPLQSLTPRPFLAMLEKCEYGSITTPSYHWNTFHAITVC